MPMLDAGALDFAVHLAKPLIEQTRAAPGQVVRIPQELAAQLNAVLYNAMLEDVLALRERERTVPVENLRLTIR